MRKKCLTHNIPYVAQLLGMIGVAGTLLILGGYLASQTETATLQDAHKCSFGNRYYGGPQHGRCAPSVIKVRSGDTMWGIASKLGDATRWGELCYYPDLEAPALIVRFHGEFNPRRIMPGTYAGGCA